MNGKKDWPPVSCEIAHHLVAIRLDARDVGGDGVNVDIGLLRHLQRLIARVAALVVLAIAQDDHGAAEFVERLVLHQLVAAGEEDGVVERRSAARPQIRDGFLQIADVVGEIGHQFGRRIETHNHGSVVLGPDGAVDERGGGFLLEMKTVANAVAGVDQDSQAQRQVGFSREFDDGLRLLAFEDLEIVLGEIGDEAAFFVRHRVEHVDARDVEGDAGLVAGIGRRGLVGVFRLLFGLAGEQQRESAQSDDGVQLLHER